MSNRHLFYMRQLRVWHYRQMRAAAKKREDKRASRFTKADADKAWALHMGFVQALNDLFPLGDTAENDAKGNLYD